MIIGTHRRTGTTVGPFKTIAEAEKATGIHNSSISRVLNGERFHAGGFIWKEQIPFKNELQKALLIIAKYEENQKKISINSNLPAPFENGNPNNVLVIGDTHEPFSRKGYLEHCRKVQEEFNCGTVIHIGDEVDNHAISFHETDPDGMSARDEGDRAMEKMKEWYTVFPNVTVIVGNHTALPHRKAVAGGLSKRFMKAYEDIWEAPIGWNWKVELDYLGVLYTHGTGSSGDKGALSRAIHSRINVVQGHNHTLASVQWSASKIDKVFAMQVGCGIDDEAYAFEYSRANIKKSVISCGVVLNGKLPIVVPMDLK
jgi:predicted phosphodiesterase